MQQTFSFSKECPTIHCGPTVGPPFTFPRQEARLRLRDGRNAESLFGAGASGPLALISADLVLFPLTGSRFSVRNGQTSPVRACLTHTDAGVAPLGNVIQGLYAQSTGLTLLHLFNSEP